MTKLIYTNSKKCVIAGNVEISIDSYIKDIDIDKEVFNYLQFLENQEIEGLRLEDFFLYNHVGMYCFERHAIYEKLKNIFYCFFVIERIKKEFGDEIIVHTDQIIMLSICTDIFNLKEGEQCFYAQPLKAQKKLKIKVGLKLILRNIIGIKGYLKFLINNKKDRYNFLSISNVMNINMINIEGRSELVDTQLGITIDALSKKYNMFNFQALYNFNAIDKSLKYKKDYVTFELFVLYKKLVGNKYIDKKLIEDNLEKLNFINYTYKQYDLRSIINKYIFKDIKNRYLDDIKELVCARNVIKKFNIKNCIVVDEGDRPREFIMAANMENVRTYALQHGIISPMSPAYIMNSRYKDKIIPNCTFVWGEKYKKILTENTNIYDDDNVKVVGQSRTDLLQQYINKEKKEDSKIKILYATQYYKDILEPATNILFKALCLMEKEYELIIKLHPADKYYHIYESLIEQYNIKNVKILEDGDIYEIINWCDVVVSVHSTVVIEGALLDKPSICILLPKYNDAGGFVRDGVSLGAKDEYDLKNYLEDIKNMSFENRFSEYIKNNFYKVDGKVTDRIVSIILKNDNMGGEKT
ncbi:hypothetical protein [Clostridium colicanis]|uniref:Capsule polysaccharide biosynthesis protein n=1 Tax=Clostridium colicanis DSM 13634 TaxID=1121305 RepID=A0A151AR79_9CLOT|nr:hypothetical protein [Clostridium colicanis]KYH30149.1 capsule polysaccharide biosynthesis protein [Clostridium colicanis DSM 13634]